MISFKDYLLLIEVTIDQIKDRTKEFKPEFFKHHDQNAQHKTKNSIIDHFAAGNQTEHVPWIISQYKKQNISQSDHERIKSTLSNFSTHKSKLANRDINQYGHINDLESALEPHLDKPKELSGKEKSKLYRNPDGAKIINHPGARVVHHENNVTAYHLQTQEAASDFGSGSSWCTVPKDGGFEHYQPLYCVHAGNSRYQFHFPTEHFKDDKERDISLDKLSNKHPELKNIEEFKKHKSLLKPNEIYTDYDYLKAKHGNHSDYTELLKKPKLDIETQQHIAEYGSNTHRTELLKRSDLQPSVHEPIANRGNDDHRSQLLKRHDLHPQTHLDLMYKSVNKPHFNSTVDSILARPKIDEHAQRLIAEIGNDDHRTALMKRSDLHFSTHSVIATHGNDNHRKELLKRSDLHPQLKSLISQNKIKNINN